MYELHFHYTPEQERSFRRSPGNFVAIIVRQHGAVPRGLVIALGRAFGHTAAVLDDARQTLGIAEQTITGPFLSGWDAEGRCVPQVQPVVLWYWACLPGTKVCA